MVSRYDKVIEFAFGGQCPKCGNAFVYEKSDIKFFNWSIEDCPNFYEGYVQCPWCEAKPRVVPYVKEDDMDDVGRCISVYPHEIFDLDNKDRNWNRGLIVN